MKLHRGKAADRAGYALVLFVMIFFGLMGLAALLIDLGFARLAQRQMQTAADSAALEGLRWRDYVDPAGQPSDQYRRQQASNVVAGLFTDYVDSGGTVQYGAGPVVSFSGGVGPADLAAAQTTTLGVPPVYQPATRGTARLEMNYPDNETNGDMSSRHLLPQRRATARPSWRMRTQNYNRRDFTPSSGTDSASAPAFLVRMRRTPLGTPAGLTRRAERQFRRSDAADPVRPRQHDGPQRYRQPVERGDRDHGPRHGHRGGG